MFTKNEIIRSIRSGKIVLDPFNEDHLNPNSYDLTLAPKLLWYPGDEPLDLKSNRRPESCIIPEDGMVLLPNELYLGCTAEYTESHGCIPLIEGRSSFARYGITVHQTGGFGDIGYCGNWTLEIMVVKPVRIYPDLRLAQIYWLEPKGLIDQIYSGKYQFSKSTDPIESRLHFELFLDREHI